MSAAFWAAALAGTLAYGFVCWLAPKAADVAGGWLVAGLIVFGVYDAITNTRPPRPL